jgi:hypothetical protein
MKRTLLLLLVLVLSSARDLGCDQGYKSQGDEVCVECPLGTYSYQGNLGDCLSCQQVAQNNDPGFNGWKAFCQQKCGENQVNSWNSTAQEFQCVCKIGAQLTNGVCQVCPQGMSSSGGNSSNICANCNPGYYEVDRVCQTCSNQTYSRTSGATACLPCPQGKIGFNPKLSEYEKGTECVCLPGYGPDENQACQKCPLGKYSNEETASNCNTCSDNSVSVDSRDDCEVCSDGKTANEDKSLCIEKFYTDEECSKLSEGGVASEDKKTCVCSAGYERKDAPDFTCAGCDPGYYSSRDLKTRGSEHLISCSKCESGYWSSAKASSCTSCASSDPPSSLSASCPKSNAGLAWGLGLGIPALILVIVGLIYYKRKISSRGRTRPYLSLHEQALEDERKENSL